MNRKPQDLLEFYRRTSGSPDEPAGAAGDEGSSAPALERTHRMLVVRRSQAIVAAVSAVLLVLLAFLLGLAVGGNDAEPASAAGGWVIKVQSYRDNEAGRRRAKSVMDQLEKLGWGEVTLQTIPSEDRLAVTLGSWVERPGRDDEEAQALRDKVAALTDKRNSRRPFRDAAFWQIKR